MGIDNANQFEDMIDRELDVYDINALPIIVTPSIW
jgi:hypothetical protein